MKTKTNNHTETKNLLIFEKLLFLIKKYEQRLKFHNRKKFFGTEIVMSCPTVNNKITKDEENALKNALKNAPKTSHLPFYGLNLACPDKNIENYSINSIKTAIELALKLGITTGVCHTTCSPLMPKKAKKKWFDRFLENKNELETFASKQNFIIAWENTYEPDFLLFDEMLTQNKNTKFCIDVGHLNCFSKHSIEDYFNHFNSNVIHAHIHDNLGNEDSHGFLGSGNINFEQIFNILKQSNVSNIVFELSREDFLKSEEKIYNLSKILEI